MRSLLVLALLVALPVLAADDIALTIENHKFSPSRIEIPTGRKVRLMIENKDAAAEEFDSSDLRVEKVIPGKAKAPVFVGPLKPGEYKFMGEFNPATAQGVIVAK
ncbi:MAG TPA: cupredoxin domain-containing protein [Usitatibacter sp.]|jgi:plastocyanin domain-containing protein|nr:cupredoxin domain-containing protein [Usitatibacter sp.]